MNGPARLLDSSASLAARELLQAGLAERPRPAALRSTAIAVGLSATAIAASTTTAAAAATVVTASAATVALKSLAVGTLVGLALAGSATFASNVTTPPPPPAALAAKTSEPAPLVAPIPATETTAAPIASVSAASPRPAKRVIADVLPPTPSAPASAHLPDGQSLSREVALIDGARRSLAAGDTAGALAQLQDYDGRPRTATLDREAQLLRVDALARAGQHAGARALAERYLQSYPNDPHAGRLRALIGSPRIDSPPSGQDQSGGRR